MLPEMLQALRMYQRELPKCEKLRDDYAEFARQADISNGLTPTTPELDYENDVVHDSINEDEENEDSGENEKDEDDEQVEEQEEEEDEDDPTQIHSQEEKVKEEVEDMDEVAKEVDYIEDSKAGTYLVHWVGVEKPEWVEFDIIDRDWWDKVMEYWSSYASKCGGRLWQQYLESGCIDRHEHDLPARAVPRRWLFNVHN